MVFEYGKIQIMLTLNEIYFWHKCCLFPFFLVQTSETVFRWIIVQDDKNSTSSHSYLYEPNFLWKFYSMYWSICCLWNVFLYFLRVFFLYYDTLKKLYHNCRHYDIKCMYSETYLIWHALWETFGVGIERLLEYTV